MADPTQGLNDITRKRKLDEDNDIPTKKRRIYNVVEEHSYVNTSRMTNTEELCESFRYEGNHAADGYLTDEVTFYSV